MAINQEDVEDTWNFIKRNMEMVLDILAPVRNFKFGSSKPGWLSNDLMELMKDRNHALKRASKSKNENNKKYARNIRNLVNHQIKKARSDYVQEQLNTLKDKPKKFWNILNDIIDPGKHFKNFKLIDDKGDLMNDLEAANKVNEFFANIGRILAQYIDKTTPQTDVEMWAVRPSVFELPKMEIESFTKIVNNIKEYKSSGMATISSKIWKIFCDNYSELLLHLFNLIIQDSVYPADWKIATVVPLPKIPNAS